MASEMTHAEKIQFHNAVVRYWNAVHTHERMVKSLFDSLPNETRDLNRTVAAGILKALPRFDVDEAFAELEAFQQQWFS